MVSWSWHSSSKLAQTFCRHSVHSASSNGVTHTFIGGVVVASVVVGATVVGAAVVGATVVVAAAVVVVTTAQLSSSLPSLQSTLSSHTHVSGMHSSPHENSPGHFLSQTGQHLSSSYARVYPSSQTVSAHTCLEHNTAPWAFAHLHVSHTSTAHVVLTSAHSPLSNSHPEHVGPVVVTGDVVVSTVVVGATNFRHEQHSSEEASLIKYSSAAHVSLHVFSHVTDPPEQLQSVQWLENHSPPLAYFLSLNLHEH
jgi:hypothetical protein